MPYLVFGIGWILATLSMEMLNYIPNLPFWFRVSIAMMFWVIGCGAVYIIGMKKREQKGRDSDG